MPQPVDESTRGEHLSKVSHEFIANKTPPKNSLLRTFAVVLARGKFREVAMVVSYKSLGCSVWTHNQFPVNMVIFH